MLLIAGLVIVFGSVMGGFVFEGGHLLVLYQPAEYIIIGGAAIGSLIVGSPPSVLKLLLVQLRGVLGGGLSRQDYLDLLAMLYQLFKIAQQSGIMALEAHFEAPEKSSVLSQYPKFMTRAHAAHFLADSIKVIIMGGISAHDLEALLDEDLEVMHEEELKPVATISKIGDALPGLGIVAAVLGVVLTMEAIDGPVTEIGHKVGAALVGTFLGILLSYGFAQPLASNLEHRIAADGRYVQCIKAGLLAMYKGFAPAISIEFARRVLPDDVRPSFEETEQVCKASRPAAQAA